MQTLPASVHEVKSIIEAVNLKTFERLTYLKGKDNLCKFPFASTLDGFKDLLFTPDGLMFDGADPDVDICLTAPLEVSPDDPRYAGDPTLSFERPVRPGEVTDLQLTIWRAHAAAAANPRESHPEERPLPAPMRDNVVKLPSPTKQAVRHDRPPVDVMRYSRQIPIGEEWERMLRVMYQKSWYGRLFEVGGYAGKCRRQMRCYTRGNKELIRSTGLSKYTVTRYLMGMKKNKIILLHKRGYKNQGCSIWELPFDLAHVFAWRRKVQK